MAAAHPPRSRSPVMSIRTQPEEENSLRAEIEAAKRTQHEILPRYSWHSNSTRRESSSNLRQVYPPVLQRDPTSRRLAKTLTQCEDSDLDDPVLPITTPRDNDVQHKSNIDVKPPWRQFTRRRVKTELANILPGKVLSIKRTDKASQRGHKSQRIPRKHKESVADDDRAAQQAQFQAWLEEKVAEREALPQPCESFTTKTRSSVRRSIGGSLSSGKDFFRVASKSPLEKLRNCTTSTSSFTPHLYSFETKDHLHAYLNHNDIVSPVSPAGDRPKLATSLDDVQPAELSAEPLAVELECTAPEAPEQVQFPVSRTSTPDVRDLPPYVDDKKFVKDMIKEQAEDQDMSRIKSLNESLSMPTASYFCSFCERNVTGEDVYDFCSMCDVMDRVVCHSCAQHGERCRHDVEQPLVSPVNTTRDETWHNASRQNSLRSARCQPSAHSKNSLSSNTKPGSDDTFTALQSQPRDDSRCTGTLEKDFNALRLDLLQQISHIRHENDLVLRERELAIRSREIDIKDQQVTLREREALVQQKSDTLMRNLETLVSYQQLAKSAFIGAQFQSQQHQDPGNETSECKAQPDTLTMDNEHHHMTKPKQADYQRRHHATVSKIVAQVEESMQGFGHDHSHVRSCAAQKRKKESHGHGSTSSTPTAASSPEHSRKALSRGNSERNESQDEEDDDEGSRFPKRNKQDLSSPNGQQLLFACPYSKFNPLRFSSRNTAEKNYRGCSTHYLPDVSRLKQHLKRVHWQPEIYCPRCFEEFQNAAQLAEHARASVACVARDCPFPEKMDRTQQEKIHVKRPRVPPETVWYDIYKVLFPQSQPPDSPYMEDDRIITTPISATPPSTVNVQAIQMLSDIFNQKLNQREDLRNHPLREAINQTLTESMTELLDNFTLSPTHSPIGGGPSIVVSPVSRSSSGKNLAHDAATVASSKLTGTTLVQDNSTAASSRRPVHERKRSVTNVVSQPPSVPKLQHPRPKPRLETALQVPQDHHRSPSGHSRRDSIGHGSAADVIFDINIASHICDDRGYDDQSQSYEQGDDKNAMAFVVEPAPPSGRNKSVISLDSGYGSGKSQRPPETPSLMPEHINEGQYSDLASQFANPGRGHPANDYTKFPDFHGTDILSSSNSQPSHGFSLQSEDGFDYSHYLDQSDQDLFRGTDYPFAGANNPWNYP